MFDPRLPQGPFGVVLADLPLAFDAWSAKGEGPRSPQAHYNCTALDQLCALPVQEIMAPNSALFLWIPWPWMEIVPWRLMPAWGCKYSGHAWTWVKFNPVTEKFAFGCGYSTRKNLEPCLLGLRGNPRRLSRSVRDFILAPKRAHSQKPDDQYAMAEALYPGPYLELFARQSWPNWTAWGDQAPPKPPIRGETPCLSTSMRSTPANT
jgi:N6-adenosine-specific RNA methylase IME4